jgi:hypothetical protein
MRRTSTTPKVVTPERTPPVVTPVLEVVDSTAERISEEAQKLEKLYDREIIKELAVREFAKYPEAVYELLHSVKKYERIGDYLNFVKAAMTDVLYSLGVTEIHQELILQIIEAVREGDDARLEAVRRALEAPTAELATAPLQLPDKIPDEQKYVKRPTDPDTGRKQSIVKFLEEGWPAPYVKARILTRPDLLHLDRAAYNALIEQKGEIPEHLAIPGKHEIIKQERPDPEHLREGWRQAKRAYRDRVAQRQQRTVPGR